MRLYRNFNKKIWLEISENASSLLNAALSRFRTQVHAQQCGQIRQRNHIVCGTCKYMEIAQKLQPLCAAIVRWAIMLPNKNKYFFAQFFVMVIKFMFTSPINHWLYENLFTPARKSLEHVSWGWNMVGYLKEV